MWDNGCGCMIISKGQKIEIEIPKKQDVEVIELKQGAHACIMIIGMRTLRLDVVLSGEDAVLEINGTFRGNADKEQNVVLRIIQDAPRTLCNIRFRVALEDLACSRFDGLIRMTERATDSRARLSYRGILLSKQSRAMPTPRLEVLTKRVASAFHEASIGTIDPQQLFYLQSRGLSRKEAERLIIDAFLI